jgi:F-type H+-transporting ATPase subunit epsilon
VFSGDVTEISLRAHDGYITVLARHAPLVSVLLPSILKIRSSIRQVLIATGSGILHVTAEETRVLVMSAEYPGEIDAARAESARQRALARLSQANEADTRAEAALLRALARLQVGSRSGATARG